MSSLYIFIIVSLLLFALFSGMEIAFVSSSKMRFAVDKTEHSIPSKILSYFYRHPQRLMTSLTVGYYVALVVYGVSMARLVELCLWQRGMDNQVFVLLLEVVLSTLLILVAGEYIPKTIAKINPNSTLKFLALPVFVLYIPLYPLGWLASLLSHLVAFLMGQRMDKKSPGTALGKTDLDYFIQTSLDNNPNQENVESEVKMFQNALDFSRTKIRDCIVPRTEIQAVDIDTDTETLKQRFIDSGKSKLIVYQDNIDNIVGYIHSSEMFRHADSWTSYIRKVPIVPETMAAQKLMKHLMQQKKSLAVVVDEFGGIAGIVSLEDLVEEIFGDIEDEHDTSSYVAKKLKENEYVLSGRLEIEKVNEMFHLGLPESEDYLTIGGLILHEYQSFPKPHETVTVGRFHFKILKITTTRIELVNLSF